MSTSPFSQLAPLFLDETHRNVLRMMETAYEQSISIGQTYWYQANQDIEYYAGNQSAWSTSYGVGIPESVDIGSSFGFGLQLVDMLTKQLDGTIRIERGNGTKFILEFQV